MKNSKKTVNSLSKVCWGILSLVMGAVIGSTLGLDPFTCGLVLGFISVLSPTPVFDGQLYTVTQNPLIGRAKNKAGGMVFTTWKGKNVIKTKPLTVAQPPSDARDRQQSIIRQLNALGRPILNFIQQSFRAVSSGSTEWASWMKYNAPEAFGGTAPDATLVKEDLTYSRGTLINPSDIAEGSPSGRAYPITWTDNSSISGNSATDKVYCAAITDSGEQYVMDTGNVRSDGTATLTIPGSTSLANFAHYVWFVKANYSNAGDSILL